VRGQKRVSALEDPVDYNHTRKQAGEYAQLANSLMDDQEIAPHPNNYSVWYNYFSGAFPDLRRALDLLLNSDQPLTEKRNSEMFEKFCASPFDAVPMHLIAEQMAAELGTVLAVLDRAGKGAADYGDVLAAATGEIADLQTTEGLRPLVARLLSETRSMAEQSRDVERQLRQSANEVARLTDELEQTRREALYDPLTGLANRKLFDDLLQRAVLSAIDAGQPLSLLFLDVDHFKRVNDSYGHQVGDQVLKLLASILQNNLKGRDTAARFGGEEFAVLLPETPLDGAVRLAQHLCEQIAAKSIVHRKSGDKLGRITVSVGVAQYVAGEPLRHVVERADAAMYKAKTAGRNRVVSEREVEARDLSVLS
jgi:diguanylate cyclase